MIKTTGCCLFRLALLGLMLAIIAGIVMYVAPAVKHDAEKLSQDYRAARSKSSHGRAP